MADQLTLNVADALKLAFELYRNRQFDDAEKLFRAVADAEPSNVNAVNGVGLCLAEDGRDYAASLAWFDRAFALLRNDMVALTCNRGRALGELGRSVEALATFDGLLKSAPDYPLARYNRGLIRLQMGRHLEAIADLDAVLAKEPDNALARFGRGFANLVLGNYEQGFADYEHRLKDDLVEPDVPLWTGAEPLDGKTILVHGEMGLGDNIMFLRYVPLLQARGAKVVLVLPQCQRTLAEEIPGVIVVGLDQSTWPHLDTWVRFMSLAYCLRTTADTVPPPLPLRLGDDKWMMPERWRDIIGNPGKLKVGLCWSGSPQSRYDAYRSIPLKQLLPLFDLPETAFYSLQLGVRERDMVTFDRLRYRGMTDLSSHLNDFRDTARAMACLDAIVTVDTSVAHLAGTVGVPTFIMLTNYRTYWLWIEKRDTSPWYPSAQMFRQDVDGDWAPVVARIRDTLRIRSAARAA